jgi:hypothetical protein
VAGVATCHVGTKTVGVQYYYEIDCIDATHLDIKRYWFELTGCSGSKPVEYAPCSCATAGVTGGWHYSSSGSQAVTCGAVSWYGTLTKRNGSLVDPVDITQSIGFSE